MSVGTGGQDEGGSGSTTDRVWVVGEPQSHHHQCDMEGETANPFIGDQARNALREADSICCVVISNGEATGLPVVHTAAMA